jgi:predicted RNase H-like HicB family nuclease
MQREYKITVTYDAEDKIYSARCEELPGLFVDAKTLEELVEAVEAGVPFIAGALAAKGHAEADNAIPLYLMKQFSENRVL